MLYAEAGITLAHEGATHASELELMQRATAAGANVIDIVAHPFMTDLEKIVAANPVSGWGTYGGRLKIGAVKITADGSPQGRTAYFTTPYLTGGPAGEKNWRGEPTMPQKDLNALVKAVYDMNVPLNVHTNGDATIDMFLTAYEAARAGDFSRPWNVTTIHTQFMRKDHIARFVEYKIRPSFYTLHTFYFASAHKANRGEAQAAYLSPMRDAIDARLRPTNHTDFYVAPLDQMFVMWSAVTRMSREGGVLGPDQRITPHGGHQVADDLGRGAVRRGEPSRVARPRARSPTSSSSTAIPPRSIPWPSRTSRSSRPSRTARPSTSGNRFGRSVPPRLSGLYPSRAPLRRPASAARQAGERHASSRNPDDRRGCVAGRPHDRVARAGAAHRRRRLRGAARPGAAVGQPGRQPDFRSAAVQLGLRHRSGRGGLERDPVHAERPAGDPPCDQRRHNGQWVAPVNLVVSQLVMAGRQPLSIAIGGRYYVDGPSGGPEWGIRFAFTMLFPK